MPIRRRVANFTLEGAREQVLRGLLSDRARAMQQRIWNMQDEMAEPTAEPDLYSNEVEKLIADAMATVSRNPNDHEIAIAYRRAISAALRSKDRFRLSVGDAEARAMMGGNNG